jgi:hypothetical protein
MMHEEKGRTKSKDGAIMKTHDHVIMKVFNLGSLM